MSHASGDWGPIVLAVGYSGAAPNWRRSTHGAVVQDQLEERLERGEQLSPDEQQRLGVLRDMAEAAL